MCFVLNIVEILWREFIVVIQIIRLTMNGLNYIEIHVFCKVKGYWKHWKRRFLEYFKIFLAWQSSLLLNAIQKKSEDHNVGHNITFNNIKNNNYCQFFRCVLRGFNVQNISSLVNKWFDHIQRRNHLWQRRSFWSAFICSLFRGKPSKWEDMLDLIVNVNLLRWFENIRRLSTKMKEIIQLLLCEKNN